jgi:hypothetical protein
LVRRFHIDEIVDKEHRTHASIILNSDDEHIKLASIILNSDDEHIKLASIILKADYKHRKQATNDGFINGNAD